MKRVLACVGALAVASTAFAIGISPGETGSIPAIGSGFSASGSHWAFGAMLWTPLSARDWLVTIAVLAFVALNVFLWSLPLSQHQLFYITAPLGVLALLAFTWFAPRR